MSNKYFIWKEEKCKGINPEWLEISGKEFYRLVSKPENAHRKFIKEPIDPENISMGFFVLEVTKDNYNKFDALRKRNERSEDVLNANRKRHKLSELTEGDELSKNVIPFVISFDAPVADEEELHYHDIVSDNGDSEDFIVDKIQLSNIYMQTRTYSEFERSLLDELYFFNTDNKSEREFARKYNIPFATYLRKKEKLLKKLKKGGPNEK